jgi:hypothetical protein
MTARYPVVLNGPTFQELQIGDTLAGQAESGANSDITSLTGLTTALSVAQGGTGVTTSTGTENVVLSTSPTLVTPILGTPTSGTLTNCTGYTFTNIASKPTTLSGYGITDAILSSTIGAASGIAPLGSDSKIASTYLPSYVDDVLEYANLAGFPGTGETAKIYVALDTNTIYRWSGSAYIEISPTVGNSDTATKLATARSISTTGDATWTVNFDGSANATAAITLASVVTAATGTKVTYNAKGLITGSTTLTVSDITDIATNYQAKHANLTAVAGLSTATTGLIKFTNGVASFDSNTYVISGGALGTPSSGTLTNCTFPTLNQNTTGTAAGLSATLAIASGGTGATSASAALTALGAQAALVSGTSIKTVNGTTLLGSGDLVVTGGASATKTIANKTASYTVIAADLGKIINYINDVSSTVFLTAAATLGSGFTCTIQNSGGNNLITIDPTGTETINGYTTWEIQPSQSITLVCDGTNFILTSAPPTMYDEKVYYGVYTRPVASSGEAIAIGNGGVASGPAAFAFRGTASSNYAIAFGHQTVASGLYSTAFGQGSGSIAAKAVTGAGAMALGGSYASGTDSFAAAIANNTSSYGAQGANAIAMGYQNRANSQGAIAIGHSNTITAMGGYPFGLIIGFGNVARSNCVVLGTYNNIPIGAGDDCIAIGSGHTNNTHQTFNFGISNTATGLYATTMGAGAASLQKGKYSYANNGFATVGDAQYGKIILKAATTTSTAVVLTSDRAAASTNNQLIVASDQAMTFFGTLIAKQSASANMASYLIKGSIVNNAGTVSISSIAIETIVDTIGLTTQPTFTADNTNKALTVTSGAKLTTSIRWVCNLDSVEVTYA